MLQFKVFTIGFWILVFFSLNLIPVLAQSKTPLSKTEILSANIDFEISVYEASGNDVILWIAPEYGFHKGQYQMAALLADQGIEVWMVDLTEMLFLPRGSRAMRQVSGEYVAELINRIHERTGKDILLMSSYYGAIPVLRGAHQWQTGKPASPFLTGAVLFSPSMYAKIPSLGKKPVYLPDVSVSNIPVMIFQGEKIGNRWQLGSLLEKLYRPDAPVYVRMMSGITSLFYREQRNPVTERYFRSLPEKLKQSIRVLKYTRVSLHPVTLIKKKIKYTALDSELMQFKGNKQPHAIRLYDIQGRKVELTNFKNRVTLINFWATWCPPCVKEIPSLNRLQKHMQGKPFQIISINYAETPEQINKFLKNFDVSFPILLDPDGTVSKQWNIFVFPSTFVIGPDGTIQYGVNAAIEWDSENTIKKLESLLLP